MTRLTALLTFALALTAATAWAQVPMRVSFLQQNGALPSANTPAPAQTPKTPAQTPSILAKPVPFPEVAKFAFINVQTLIQESAAGKAASLQLKKLQDAKFGEVQAKTQTLKGLQDKQQSGGGVLSASAAAQVQKDIEQAQMDLQYAQQKAQKELDDLQAELMDKFSSKVGPAAEQVRADKGLWAILTIDSTVAAMMPGLDVSLDVVKQMDAHQ